VSIGSPVTTHRSRRPQVSYLADPRRKALSLFGRWARRTYDPRRIPQDGQVVKDLDVANLEATDLPSSVGTKVIR